MTRTISPLTSPRKRRASSPSVPRATSSCSFVSSRQTAAGRSGASAASARERLADAGAATRRRRRSRPSAAPAPSRPRAAAGSPRSASGRSAGRRRPAPPCTADGPGQHLDLEVALDAAADQLVAGVGDAPACPASLRQRDLVAALDPLRQLRRPRRFVALVVGDRARRRADAEPVEQAAGAAGVLAGDESASTSASRTRGVTSSRLPIGVGQTISRPAISPPAPLPRARPRQRGGADHAGVGPELGRDDRGLVHRRQRPLPQLRARRARAAGRRPRSRRRRSRSRRGSKMLAKLATARRRAGCRQRRRLAIAVCVAGRAPPRSRAVPSISSPVGERLGQRRVRLALGRAPAPRRASAVPEASASTQPWFGQLPWQGGPSTSITTWPSSAPAPVEPAVDLAAEDQAAADPGADRQHHRVRARRARRRRGARRAPRRWRRCRRRPAGPMRSATRSRIGRFVERQVDGR